MHKRPVDDLIYQSTPMRVLFFALGVLFLALGLVGVVVPGMPTTVFVLLAAYCWARSSRRFYLWLLSHRLFGKMIIDWQTRRAMPRFAKYLAWLMMSVSALLLFWRLPSDLQWLAWLVSAISLGAGIWIARLPDA
ncbi:YbaN family protein [Moraxella sp. ZJ142]|uniref:YbaN family protein n=1 Tax=Moraxella marmotae TaxID=3344520 RepID=UPI0035D43808